MHFDILNDELHATATVVLRTHVLCHLKNFIIPNIN
jgi:hypothetical protein